MRSVRTDLSFTVDVSTWSPRQLDLLRKAVDDIDGLSDASERTQNVSEGPQVDQSSDSVNAGESAIRTGNGSYEDIGWPTRGALLELLTRLQAGGYDSQAWAVRACLDQGGSLRRGDVLRHLGKDVDATLRGWTRPINRIVAEMRSAGSVDPDAVLPLYPQSADDGRADYFVAPEPLVRLWFNMGRP